MRQRRTRTALREGHELSESEITALLAVRARNIGLKADVPPEADEAKFRDVVRRSVVATLHAEADRVVGLATFEVQKRQWQGRTFSLAFGGYGFVDVAYRGDASYARKTTLWILRQVMRSPLTPFYFFGESYLPSYVRVRKNVERVYTPFDTGPEWEISLLEHLCKELDGYDPATGLVTMPTLPLAAEEASAKASPNPQTQRLVEAYEERNPNWRDGYCVPTLFRSSFWSSARVIWLNRRKRSEHLSAPAATATATTATPAPGEAGPLVAAFPPRGA